MKLVRLFQILLLKITLCTISQDCEIALLKFVLWITLSYYHVKFYLSVC